MKRQRTQTGGKKNPTKGQNGEHCCMMGSTKLDPLADNLLLGVWWGRDRLTNWYPEQQSGGWGPVSVT